MTLRERQERERGRRIATIQARRDAKLARRFLDQALSVAVQLPVLKNTEGVEMDEFGLHHGQRWQVFSAFNISGRRFVRGSFLTDQEAELVQRSVNYQQIRESFLRPGTPPPEIKAQAVLEGPPPHVFELASSVKRDSWSWRLAEAIVETKRPASIAIDLVPSDLLQHANSEFGSMPKPIPGAGKYRRDVSWFMQFLRLVVDQVVEARQKAKAS